MSWICEEWPKVNHNWAEAACGSASAIKGGGGHARGSIGNRGGGVIGQNGVGKVLWKDLSLITLIIQDSVHLLKYVTGVHLFNDD